MVKNIFLIGLLIILNFQAAFSQNDIKNYEPPKVIEGSELRIDGNADFSIRKNDRKSRDYGISLYPSLSKFRYSDRVNYIIHTRLRGGFSHLYYEYASDINSSNYSDFSIGIEGGFNYYLIKNLIYGGLNGSSYSRFTSTGKPHSDNYLGPNIGLGRIVNASQVTRSYFFEQVLKKEKLISGSLPENVRKKLTELFDKRNNREFIYKFKEDSEIEFFSDIEKLLRDEGVIQGILDARTVLKLYQTLVNGKYLLYPKFKGYQIQSMFFYPVSNSNNNSPNELVFSGIYGHPISVKTQIVFYGIFSKLFNPLDNSSFFLGSNVRNIFPLSIEDTQLDDPNSWFFMEHSIGHFNETADYYFGGNVSVYHNFTDFIGIRGYANVLYTKDKFDKRNNSTIFTEQLFLDYGIISRLILRGGLSSYITYYNGRTNYRIFGSLRLSYILF